MDHDMKKIGEKFENGLKEDNDKRKSIQSVEIGVRVLLALVETGGGEGAFLREVADHSGLSRSQAHRYLLSFVNTGVAEQDERSGRYYLGGLTVRLGLAAMARLDTVRIAAEHLEDLLAEMKTTGLLSVWGDYGPTVIRWIDGGIPLFTSLHTGSVLPLQTSSTGILFLAHCLLNRPGNGSNASVLRVLSSMTSNLPHKLRRLGGWVSPGLTELSYRDYRRRRCQSWILKMLGRDNECFGSCRTKGVFQQGQDRTDN